MKESEKEWIKGILIKLNFVNWDRYFEWEGGKTFFGWIERKYDSYKDFVLIDFVQGEQINFATSSKENSKKIAEQNKELLKELKLKRKSDLKE